MSSPRLWVGALLAVGSALATSAGAQPTTSGGAAYIKECRDAGVPIPPGWGDAQWIPNGQLADPFISTDKDAFVYYHESASPRGVCIALPRVRRAGDPGGPQGEVTLLGIICQGNDTSKACFWDNSTFTLPSVSTSKPLSAFTGGGDLRGKTGGVCTSCHAGENVFNIQPGSALDLRSRGVDLIPNDYVDVLVHPDWPQNPGPSTLEGACNDCHNPSFAGRLPEVSTDLSGYCNRELRKAVEERRTMPPGGLTPPTAVHFAALDQQCNEPPADPGPPPGPFHNPGLAWLLSAG